MVKICIYLLLWVHSKRDQERTYLIIIMQIFFSDFLYKGICYGYSFELHQQVDAIHMSTHNICLYEEVDKKYIRCNLKTTELFDYALIGVCVVISSNTVIWSVCIAELVLLTGLQDLRFTRGGIHLMTVEYFNAWSLFFYPPSILSIWLKFWWKRHNTSNYHCLHYLQNKLFDFL